MSFIAAYPRARIYSWITILTAGLLALLFFSMQYSFVTAGSQFKFVGTVFSAPTDPNGIGAWTIRRDDQHGSALYTVAVDQNTTFDNGLPAFGQQVEVRGDLQRNNQVLATRITIVSSSGGGGNQETDLRGLVLTAPPAGGQWIIRSSQRFTQTIVTDDITVFDHGVPVVGQWMEVKATSQSDRTFLAKRLRPDDFEANEVVVRLVTGVVSNTIASRYGLVPQSTLLASGHIYLFTTTQDGIENDSVQQMAHDPDVIWAELNYIGRIPTGNPARTFRWGGVDPSGYINQSAFTQVDLAPALAHYNGAGSIVAVLDTGVDLDHPALAGHLIPGWDMVADDDTPQDEGTGLGWGHGTHVAGIIAHIAPNSQIMPVRVLDSNGRGNTFTLAYAIDWAVSQHANVINLSLGADADSHVLHEAIDRATAQGVIVVAAAGNDNSNVAQYPVSYAGVVGVTAVDSANIKADFANFGQEWVDVAAPGVGITSTIITADGSGYASWSGTSMATSFVSGAAALVHQKFPQVGSADIAQVLHATADNINGLNPTYAGQLGGLLDIGAALAAPVVTPTPVPGTQQPLRVYLPLVKKRK